MYNQLTREQRYGIYLGLEAKESQKEIARKIGVHPSTISRELKRNTTKRGVYVWNKAHDRAIGRRTREPGNRGLRPTLVWRIKNIIKTEQWSPKQISGSLALEGIKVSHEAIYQIIRKDESGELREHTRHKMKYKRHKKPIKPTKATNIANRTSIHQRPIEADGTRFGDWEMDLIIGKDGKGEILTLTERSTNLILMEKLKHGKNAKALAKVVVRLLFPYRKKACHTITTDNGSEFAAHELITKGLKGVKVYFADSYCSWQKGAIENANKLIRQYIPKGADFKDFSDKTILKIQKKINARPREKLGFKSPKFLFFKLIA